MRSRDEELEALSKRWFGFKKSVQSPWSGSSSNPGGETDVLPFPVFRLPNPKIPIIEPGALSSLETGQSFIAIGSRIYEEPHWPVPHYH
jgi:hypothetical protein